LEFFFTRNYGRQKKKKKKKKNCIPTGVPPDVDNTSVLTPSKAKRYTKPKRGDKYCFFFFFFFFLKTKKHKKQTGTREMYLHPKNKLKNSIF